MDFLGETAIHEKVLNAKLTEEEKLDLDQVLSLAELDKSINEANMKSAPGPDGLINPFIKHFWHLFRVPLYKYANKCFSNGNLSDGFRRARIRLIPKKGNTKLLKNWRPISLLNCFYKIISRAFTNRLKNYMDKLTPTAQKGYSYFVIGIQIFKFNIFTELHKFSNRIILYLEGCLISATPSVNLAHFLGALPS